MHNVSASARRKYFKRKLTQSHVESAGLSPTKPTNLPSYTNYHSIELPPQNQLSTPTSSTSFNKKQEKNKKKLKYKRKLKTKKKFKKFHFSKEL